MSNSVWYEQVDIALIDLVHRVLGKDMKVRFRGEDDFTDIAPPYVAIEHLGETFDKFRYDKTPVRVGNKEGCIVIEESAKPYTLHYQVTLTTDTITEMNRMSMLWNNEVLAHYNLDVIDMGGTKRSSFMSVQGRPIQQSEGQNEDRIFRSTYLYNIWVEIDEVKSDIKPIVQEVKIL